MYVNHYQISVGERFSGVLRQRTPGVRRTAVYDRMGTTSWTGSKDARDTQVPRQHARDLHRKQGLTGLEGLVGDERMLCTAWLYALHDIDSVGEEARPRIRICAAFLVKKCGQEYHERACRAR